MIKANELRIGNWFSLHSAHGYNGDVQLLAEGILGCQKSPEKFNHSYVPFRLDKDWFTEFQFALNEKDNSWHYGRISLLKAIGGRWSMHIDGTAICSIEYVHELQNVCFFLSGKELKRKMKYRFDSILHPKSKAAAKQLN